MWGVFSSHRTRGGPVFLDPAGTLLLSVRGESCCSSVGRSGGRARRDLSAPYGDFVQSCDTISFNSSMSRASATIRFRHRFFRSRPFSLLASSSVMPPYWLIQPVLGGRRDLYVPGHLSCFLAFGQQPSARPLCGWSARGCDGVASRWCLVAPIMRPGLSQRVDHYPGSVMTNAESMG